MTQPLIVDDEARLLCRLCGCPSTHIDTVTVSTASGWTVAVTAEGEDGHSTVSASLRQEEAPVHTRRHVVSLYQWCEQCGETSVTHLRQHKGDTQVLTEVAYEVAIEVTV